MAQARPPLAGSGLSARAGRSRKPAAITTPRASSTMGKRRSRTRLIGLNTPALNCAAQPGTPPSAVSPVVVATPLSCRAQPGAN